MVKTTVRTQIYSEMPNSFFSVASALSICDTATMQLIDERDVEIASMLTPALERAEKSLPPEPG